MPKFRVSVYRVVIVTQILLLVSLILPSAFTNDATLAKSPSPDRLQVPPALDNTLRSISTPAELIDYLQHHHRDSEDHLQLITERGDLIFERLPPRGVQAHQDNWLQRQLRRILGTWSSSPIDPRYTIGFDHSELRDWKLVVTRSDPSLAQSPLPHLQIGIDTILSSLFIMLMLSVLASRIIQRPIDLLKAQLSALQSRTRHHLDVPPSSPQDLDAFLHQLVSYISKQKEILAEAGYASSLMQQVFDGLNVPIMVIDSEGTLRLSNSEGRKIFRIGSHPNIWTYLPFAHNEAVKRALEQSIESHQAVRLSAESELPETTTVRALIRGNESPWLFFTLEPREAKLRAIKSSRKARESAEFPSVQGTEDAPSKRSPKTSRKPLRNS